MRTSARSLLVLTLLAGQASCKKDDVSEPPPVVPPAPLAVSTFSQLDTGNYWVYERRQVDSLDVVQGTGLVLDSLYVTGDTTLNGEEYTVIRKATNGAVTPIRYFWRDSADCIVSSEGEVLFASATFDQVIHSSYSGGPDGLQIDHVVQSGTMPVSVPAGEFTAYLVLGQCTSIGNFPVIPEWKYPRTYWTGGVGRVKWYAYFASGSLGYRYELVRYHVG